MCYATLSMKGSNHRSSHAEVYFRYIHDIHCDGRSGSSCLGFRNRSKPGFRPAFTDTSSRTVNRLVVKLVLGACITNTAWEKERRIAADESFWRAQGCVTTNGQQRHPTCCRSSTGPAPLWISSNRSLHYRRSDYGARDYMDQQNVMR